MEYFYEGESYPPLCSLVAEKDAWTELSQGEDIHDILILLKVFTSRSQAKKNFRWTMPCPGFNFYWGVGKCRVNICLYKPGIDYSLGTVFDNNEEWAKFAIRLGLVSLDGVTIRDPEHIITGAGQVLSVVGRSIV